MINYTYKKDLLKTFVKVMNLKLQRQAPKKGGPMMAKVGIVMGSDSDMPVMAKAAEVLDVYKRQL